MTSTETIPTGILKQDFTMRPATMADLEGCVAVANACSRDLVGADEFSVDEYRIEWQDPGFDLAADARLMTTSGGKIVGFIEVWSRPPHVRYWLWGRVQPDFRGQGIGTWLMQWAESRARRTIPNAPEGARVVAHSATVSRHEAAKELFGGQGFRPMRHFWTMAIDLDTSPPSPAWPPGIAVRTLARGQEERDVYLAIDDAFRDHWGHVETSPEEGFQRWLHRLEGNPDFDPSLWFLAMDGGEIAGVALCHPKRTEYPDMGWIDVLGVRRPWRRQGLAQALLHHSFGEFYRRGQRRAGLGVDASSLTGATRLYEKVGMQVIRQFDLYEKELRPGRDLMTQAARA